MQEIIIFISREVFSSLALVLIILFVMVDMLRRGFLREAILVVGGFFVTLLLIVVLKVYFHVPRPEDALVMLGGYAFPSGHATSVVFLAYVLWFYVTKILCMTKKVVPVLLVVLVLLVGASRLYLGVHTVFQVLSGYALGAIVSFFLLFLLNKSDRFAR